MATHDNGEGVLVDTGLVELEVKVDSEATVDRTVGLDFFHGFINSEVLPAGGLVAGDGATIIALGWAGRMGGR